MMNFRKTVWATMIAVPTLFTACSEPEVSDEVTQLRQTQSDLLAERVEAQRLENALQELENALKALANERDSIDYQRQILDDLVAIEKANLEMQTALDDLANYLLTQGLAEAAEYLADYGTETANANTVLTNIVTLEADIARRQAFIATEEGETVNFTAMTQVLENDVAVAQADVTSLQNSITALEAIVADLSALEAERDGLLVAKTELEVANAALGVDKAELKPSLDVAVATLKRANDVIALMDGGLVSFDINNDEIANEQDIADGFQNELAKAQVDAQDAEEEIAETEAAIAATQAEISQLQDLLAPYESQLASATATYNSELTTAQNRFDTWREAQNELDAIDVNFDPGDAEYDDALLARDNARALFEDVAGNYIDGADPYDFGSVYDMANDNGHTEADANNGIQDWIEVSGQGGTTYGDARIAFDLIADEFDEGGTAAGYQSDIEELLDVLNVGDDLDNEDNGLLAALEAAQADLLDAQEAIAEATAEIAALQVEYDDAVANLDTYEDDVDAVNDAIAAIDAQIAANNAAISNYENVIEQIEGGDNDNPPGQLNIVKDVLADLYTQLDGNNTVDGSLAKLEEAQKALADNNVSLQEWNAIIARMQEELVFLNEEYQAHLTLAEAYLAAYNAALNNAG